MNAAILGGIMGDEQKGSDVSMIRIGGEEAAHSLQDYADFADCEINPDTGEYVEPSSM